MNTPQLQRAVFLLLLAGITLAFLWVLAPFAGAVLWAVTLALLFNPLFQRLRRLAPGVVIGYERNRATFEALGREGYRVMTADAFVAACRH